jgi:hypothetical protein
VFENLGQWVSDAIEAFGYAGLAFLLLIGTALAGVADRYLRDLVRDRPDHAGSQGARYAGTRKHKGYVSTGDRPPLVAPRRPAGGGYMIDVPGT